MITLAGSDCTRFASSIFAMQVLLVTALQAQQRELVYPFRTLLTPISSVWLITVQLSQKQN